MAREAYFDLCLDFRSIPATRVIRRIYASPRFLFQRKRDANNPHQPPSDADGICISHEHAGERLPAIRALAEQRVYHVSNEIEMFPLHIPFVRAKGNVLVGGLGVGALGRLMCARENVRSVTVVEFRPDVIRLYSFQNIKLKIIENDFYNYLREQNLSRFDYIYFDILSDGAHQYGSVVIPMRNYLLEHYPSIPFDFWNEDQLKAEYLLAALENHQSEIYA
jgi:hypothetical protein